jgi:segregation and condensation protein B
MTDLENGNGGAGTPPAPQSGHGQPGNGGGSDAVTAEGLDEREVKAILEALLFVSHEPITLDRLTMVIGGLAKSEVASAVRSLQQDYDAEGRGLRIVELAGGFQIITRPDCAPWIKRLEKVKAAPKLSRSALETLSIIAYKQPVVRSEIEAIRSVETSGVLRTLLDRRLVRMVGRKDVPGRPIMYGTTKLFLQQFGLRDLADLPPLRDLKDLGEPELPFTGPEDEAMALAAPGTAEAPTAP